MQSQMEAQLRLLVGLAWWEARRTVSMMSFHFGEQHTVPGKHPGQAHEVGTYALHFEVSWRIVGPQGVWVGSSDRFYPAGEDPYADLEDFDEDKPGSSRCDERLQQLLNRHKHQPMVVIAAHVDSLGNFRLFFHGGYELQTFHNSSLDAVELWRLFKPADLSNHFVVTSKGIEDQEEDDANT